MIDIKQIKQKIEHLKDDDKIILSKALDAYVSTSLTDLYTYTDFLDMQKVTLLTTLTKDTSIKFNIFGGYRDAERCMICFYTEKYCEFDFPIDTIEIQPEANKFTNNKINHRDYLGAVLGLGINRSKIGDILLYEGKATLFVHKEISQFIHLYLEQVGRVHVRSQIIPLSDVVVPDPDYKVINTTVSSMRLDTIISRGFNMSRSVASNYIKGGKAYINWANIKNPSKLVQMGDRITLRGFGKIILNHVGNKTKKDRVHVTLHRY